MAYIQETCKTGRIIEVRKTICRSHKGRGARNTKTIPTADRVEKSNEKIALRTLRRKLNTNFGPEDLWVTLTYKGEAPEKEEAKKELDNFLRRLRREYKKAGKEMKYIVVTEYEAKRIHHHAVLNSIDPQLLQEVWQRGIVNARPMEADGNYEALAEYMIKETKRTFREENATGKRYRCSRNLKPYDEMKREVIGAKEFRREPKAVKGYWLNKQSVIRSMFFFAGALYESQEYYMTKIETWKEKQDRKRMLRERSRWNDHPRAEKLQAL